MPHPIGWYDTHAPDLVRTYELADPAKLHDWLKGIISETPGTVLDIGAGSGRDAAWFAGQGHDVNAVEPSSGMRSEGQRFHADPRIRWMDDRLPELSGIGRLGISFDLVMLNAVWQHVAPLHANGPSAFRTARRRKPCARYATSIYPSFSAWSRRAALGATRPHLCESWRRHPLSPRNSSRPNQERQNNRPNNTPADPRDVRVSRLPFENFLMNGHQESPNLCLEPIFSQTGCTYTVCEPHRPKAILRTRRAICDFDLIEPGSAEPPRGYQAAIP